MTPLDLLVIALGLALIFIGQIDLFLTVLHSGGHGFLSRSLYHGGWSIMRGASKPLPTAIGERVLGFGGPLLMVATLAMWLGLQWLGYALVYLPAMGRGHFTLDPGVDPSLLDAIYLSGVTLSTLGYGDATPTTPIYELATVLEALSGFGILTLSISYILGVYGVLRDQRLVGAELHDFANETGEPLVLAQTLVRSPVADSHLGELHRHVLRYHEGLHRFPIVYYFRPSDPNRSLPYVLVLMAEAAAALRWCLPSEHRLASTPPLVALVVAIRRMAQDVATQFLFGKRRALPEPSEEEARALGERFEDVANALDDRAATGTGEHHEERREHWVAYVGALHAFGGAVAADLGYEEEAIDALLG